MLSVDDLLRGDIQLASPPAIYLALKSIADDPNKSVEDACKVIESDASLAMKLLKIVNSAFYGLPGQVSSIAKAISMVGMRELQNLVLTTIIIERFSHLPGLHFSMHDFWARNLRTALIARELDAFWKRNQTDTAFLCGLVHHIGQLVMYRRIPVLAREVELLMQVQGPNEVDESTIQREVIGFDHFEVGAALARLWNLPVVVAQSIALHHAPDSNQAYEGIATLVRIACHLGQLNLPPYSTITNPEFALTADEASVILEKTHQDFEVIFKFFYPTV
jgi:HD-like signal output (HDOD) protein